MKTFFAALCLSALAFAQAGTNTGSTGVEDKTTSLADVAKKSRDAKTATAKKVYDNDTMPTTGGVSVVGAKSVSQPTYYQQPADPVRDQKMIDNQWHNQLEGQKAQISNLERQLDVAEKNEAASAHYYAVNDNQRYTQYKAQVDSLKQQIEDAKKRLADMQDEAHKAGANKAYD